MGVPSIRRSAAAVMICLIMILPAMGDIYSWTDSQGVRHFANAPPPDREQVKQQNEIRDAAGSTDEQTPAHKENLIKILEGRQTDEDIPPQKASPTLKPAKATGAVLIYTTPTCGYCKQTKAFFARHEIAYTEYDITTDPAARQRFQALKGKGVPLIFIGDQRIDGYSESRLKKLLGIP